MHGRPSPVERKIRLWILMSERDRTMRRPGGRRVHHPGAGR